MIIGVGLLLFAPINGGAPELFTVEELRDKPKISKRAGMWSFPLETFEASDICPRNTIYRLIQEEIDMSISPELIEILEFSRQEFRPIPGREDITILYSFGLFKGEKGRIFKPQDDDVKPVGWKTFDELLAHEVRVEVAPILGHYRENYLKR